jgi:ParB/RepB/Spo0J family partition protein
MKIEPVFLEKINVSKRLRQLDEAVVVSLVESMKHLGQLYPITICSPNENEVHLVTGAHRVEAAKRLGWDDIAAIFVTDNEIDREMQEVAENLHRAELTALEEAGLCCTIATFMAPWWDCGSPQIHFTVPTERHYTICHTLRSLLGFP